MKEDAAHGHIWSEQDTISSFYRALRPLVDKMSENSVSGTDSMRLLLELGLDPEKPRYRGEHRLLDMALVKITDAEIAQPCSIIAQFEFKYGWDYVRANVESRIRKDIRKISDGNDGWSIWGIKKWPAKTEYVFFGLVADKWKDHIKGSSTDPNNSGILHPNGTHRYAEPTTEDTVPRLSDKKPWLNYFELHGPFSVKQDEEDYILSQTCKWSLLSIDDYGDYREVNQ